MVASVEPFGVGAFQLATKYWTATERNTLLPRDRRDDSLEPRDVVRRVRSLLLGAGLGAVFSPRSAGAKTQNARLRRPSTRSRRSQRQRRNRLRCAPTSSRVTTRAIAARRCSRWPASTWRRVPQPGVLRAARHRRSSTPIGGLWYAGEVYGNTIYPVTRVMIETLTGLHALPADRRDLLRGRAGLARPRTCACTRSSTPRPAPDWAFVAAEDVAIALVLLATIAASTLAALLVQLLKGYTNFELGKYLALVRAALDRGHGPDGGARGVHPDARAAQVRRLARDAAFIVAQIALAKLGFEHNLYQYAGGSDSAAVGHERRRATSRIPRRGSACTGLRSR